MDGQSSAGPNPSCPRCGRPIDEGKLLARTRNAGGHIDGLFFNPKSAPVKGPDFGRLTLRRSIFLPGGTQDSIHGWQCTACRLVLA